MCWLCEQGRLPRADPAHNAACAGQSIDKDSILSVPCDVLVPAAIGGVITAETALSIQAKFVVEAANGPTDPGGDAVLRERGIVVLPDIYTNGGACMVACAPCWACNHLFQQRGFPACIQVASRCRTRM